MVAVARLVRVGPRVDPGYRRVRAGRGFRYLDVEGRDAAPADRRRIADLVIPPAWQDVWISADPLGHIQAVGTDQAGRTQYIYHRRWRARRDRDKFARALALAAALPRARARVTTALRRREPDREHALAVAFRLLDAGALRVGSDRYLERHGSRGLTTLRRRDTRVDGSVIALSFPAKSGQRADLRIDDADLAAAVSALGAGPPRAALLWYRAGRRHRRLTAADVNAYIRAVTGGDFTAKDFRTLHGTIIAADALARIGRAESAHRRTDAESLAIHATAHSLGNTAAVARGSYIDPRVFTAYEQGRLLDLSISADSAIRRLLVDDEHD